MHIVCTCMFYSIFNTEVYRVYVWHTRVYCWCAFNSSVAQFSICVWHACLYYVVTGDVAVWNLFLTQSKTTTHNILTVLLHSSENRFLWQKISVC